MPKSKSKRPRTLADMPIPFVTLKGDRIVISGMNWAVTATMLDQLKTAGAIEVGTATPVWPGVIHFKDAPSARKVFQDAFNVEPAWEELTESVPDETRWIDPVGMDDIAKGIVDG